MSYISKDPTITCTSVSWCDKEEEMMLRNSDFVKERVADARKGDEYAKRTNFYRLVNGQPYFGADEGYRHNDELEETGKFVLDYDVHNDWETCWNAIKDRVEELGILQFECSVHYGAHITLRRTEGLSILQNIILLEQKTGLEFDHKCQDLARAIYLVPSEDVKYVHPDYWEKVVDMLPHEEPTLIEEESVTHQSPIALSNLRKSSEFNDDSAYLEYLINLIAERKIDITSDYNIWIRLGLCIANYFSFSGIDLFHKLSQFYPRYDWKETEKVYANLVATTKGLIGIGSFIKYAREAGAIE